MVYTESYDQGGLRLFEYSKIVEQAQEARIIDIDEKEYICFKDKSLFERVQ